MDTLFEDFPIPEKTAYLEIIASLATANRDASVEKLSYLSILTHEANLPLSKKEVVMKVAQDPSGQYLAPALNVLRKSDLRFSLIADLIHFAESDKKYSEDEKKNIEKIAAYLSINSEQLSVLDHFVKKVSENYATPQKLHQENFLSSIGLTDRLKNAGINLQSIRQGLLATVGPMVLSKVLGSRLSGVSVPGLASDKLSAVVSQLNEKSPGRVGELFSRLLRCYK